MTRRFLPAANLLMGAVFVFGAVVQYNDPDPLRWIAMYLAAALVCALYASGRGRWWIPGLVALAAVAWAASLAPGVIGRTPFLDMFGAWEMKNTGIEESREMYGLAIVAGWMLLLAAAGARARVR